MQPKTALAGERKSAASRLWASARSISDRAKRAIETIEMRAGDEEMMIMIIIIIISGLFASGRIVFHAGGVPSNGSRIHQSH